MEKTDENQKSNDSFKLWNIQVVISKEVNKNIQDPGGNTGQIS